MNMSAPSRRIVRTRDTTGATRAADPRTRVRFAVFEPTTLPSAMSTSPRPAARPETSISGAEVPRPMTSAPMRIGDNPRAAETWAADTTNRSAARVSRASPPMRNSTERIIGFGSYRRAIGLQSQRRAQPVRGVPDTLTAHDVVRARRWRLRQALRLDRPQRRDRRLRRRRPGHRHQGTPPPGTATPRGHRRRLAAPGPMGHQHPSPLGSHLRQRRVPRRRDLGPRTLCPAPRRPRPEHVEADQGDPLRGRGTLRSGGVRRGGAGPARAHFHRLRHH